LILIPKKRTCLTRKAEKQLSRATLLDRVRKVHRLREETSRTAQAFWLGGLLVLRGIGAWLENG
jgi:hypothetical protein